MNRLLLTLYRFLLMPAVVIALPFVALFNRKLRLGLSLRRKRLVVEPLVDRPIWIHAASGEFEYAKAVIRELKILYPRLPVIVTYFSPTYKRAVETFPGVHQSFPLPLDLPGPCRSFLRQVRPRVLLLARTDLWPELLEQCRQENVKVILFSFTQKTFHSRFKKLYTRWIMHWIEQIYCVSPADQANVTSLTGSTPVAVTGDTRFDQVQYRLTHPRPLPEIMRPSLSVPVLIAGSTWPQDEAVILPALRELLISGRLKLILVPHEPDPEYIARLQLKLTQLDLATALYSAERAWNEQSVLLVDRVGVLADLYAWAQYALIGGSFRGSVHSVMEALGAGCMAFVGPHHHNNREASEFNQLELLDVVHGGEELCTKVTAMLSTPEHLVRRRTLLQQEFKRRLGASQKLVVDLAPYLT